MVRHIFFWVALMSSGLLLRGQEPVNVQRAVIEDKGITTGTVSSHIKAKADIAAGERGFCYSVDHQPTRADDCIKAGSGTGRFLGKLGGLKKATVYHVRPFVMVDSVPYFGQETTFTTHTFIAGTRIDLQFVEGGTFQMGCTVDQSRAYGDEFPVHRVEVGSFQMSIYEITCAQYCAFLNERNIPGDGTFGDKVYVDVQDSDCPLRYSGGEFVPKPGKGNYPVTEVTWYGAQAFCDWMGGSLPTAAEWEYAAKGGSKREGYKYSGANQIDRVAWYRENAQEGCHPVGQKAPNELGLYDMSGNVWEWCSDWYGFDYYGRSPAKNPTGPASGQTRCIRGGAWNIDAWNCRVSNRSSKSPGFTYNYYGFRLVIPHRSSSAGATRQ